MTISPPPAAPSRQDPATFSDRADAFAAWLVGAVPQFNALAGGSNDSGNFQNIEVTGQITGDAVTQSPTDTTAGRLIRADHGFTRGNILGAVSEAAGVPTGAIIEHGSNSNGDFVRFADGTQICHLESDMDNVLDTPLGAGFRSDNTTFIWPAAFVAPPRAWASVEARTVWANVRGTETDEVIVRAFSFTEGSAILTARVIGMGRWF